MKTIKGEIKIPIPMPHNESERLQCLRSLEILDTATEPAFDAIVKIAAKFFDVPIALISLVDTERQWFKAKVGLSACETGRELAFCTHAIMSDDAFIVENALLDPMFRENPLVLGDPNIRFYAGAPLILDENMRIGTLCIIDTKPRWFSKSEINTLKGLADQIVSLLKLHRFARHASIQTQELEAAQKKSLQADLIFENMNDGMVLQDSSGKILLANSSACRILGLTYNQLIGVTSMDPRWRAIDEDGENLSGEKHPAMVALETNKPVIGRIMGVDKPNGDRVWIRVSAQPIFEDDCAIACKVAVTFIDITAARALENELRLMSEKAETASMTKSEFLANMSHEIRTPLNGVIGIASALSSTSLSDKQREMVELMQSSGRTLERLLSDILDISKVEAGQIVLEELPFDLTDAAGDVVELVRYHAESKGLLLRVDLTDCTGRSVIGDIVRFKQILSNLTSNAIKFTPMGEVAVKVSASEENNCVEIVVKDTGIGMSDTAIDTMFDRFTQADATISRRFGGSGLGLSISKALIEKMGGSLVVTSEPNIGTEFVVKLPLKVMISADSIVAANYVVVDNEQQDEIRILLVEDHIVNQKVFQMLLEPLGLEIAIANNGLEGVETFKAQKFDAVFMDIQMPIMDGLAATQAIREYEIENSLVRTPIIALSANAGKDYVDAAIKSGVDDYLTKPIDFNRLTSKLEECLYGTEGEDIAMNA